MGSSISQTKAVGPKAAVTKAMGSSISQTKAVGPKTAMTKAVSFIISQTKAAGPKTAMTTAVGSSISQTKAVGPKTAMTKAVSFSISQSKAAGPKTAMTMAVGSSISQTKAVGPKTAVAKAIGSSISQTSSKTAMTKAVGFSLSQTKAVGSSTAVLFHTKAADKRVSQPNRRSTNQKPKAKTPSPPSSRFGVLNQGQASTQHLVGLPPLINFNLKPKAAVSATSTAQAPHGPEVSPSRAAGVSHARLDRPTLQDQKEEDEITCLGEVVNGVWRSL
jgi:hypothetical protein